MSQSFPPNSPPPDDSPAASYSMPQRSTSAAAVASLVVGVLGCIPFIPGFLAVVFASFGLRATRNPQVGGRGLAIAGLVLGLTSLCGWGGLAGWVGLNYLNYAPARTVARQFTTDLSVGNVAAASAVAPTVPSAEIQTASDALKPLGPLVSLKFMSYSYNSTTGSGSVVKLRGFAAFAKSGKMCTFTLTGVGSSSTVTAFTFQ